MKKLTFLFLLTLLPMIISANNVQIDGIYYNLDNETKKAEVTCGNNKYSGNVTIPEKITYDGLTYSVTSIGDCAFRKCSALTSVIIGICVKKIDTYAFYECYALTSITIGKNVEEIDEWAFYGCTSLKFVHITDLSNWCKIKFKDTFSNPLYYAAQIFSENEEIKDLIIPDNVESIKAFAFYNCSNLTSVTIPDGVTSIGYRAFCGCTNLSSVIIPNSMELIGRRAFAECPNLTKVYCHAEKLPIRQGNVFKHSLTKFVVLYVPDVSVDTYKKNSPWSKFGIIQPLSETSNK